jgi:hypothetical protein
MSELSLDAAGRRRSPATMPAFHVGRPLRNKGMRMNGALCEPLATGFLAGDRRQGSWRLPRAGGPGRAAARVQVGLIVVLWRAGLRIHEAL